MGGEEGESEIGEIDSPLLSMIAAQTLGPISEEARLVIPNSPKNTVLISQVRRQELESKAKHLLPS